MSEMLANQYFLRRKYQLAIPYLEKALILHPERRNLAKKLIICYSQTGRTKDCIDLFYQQVRIDPRLFLSTDTKAEDCPCSDIVASMLKEKDNNLQSPDFFNILGVLSLYCNLETSLECFRKSLEMYPEQVLISEIHTLLSQLPSEVT